MEREPGRRGVAGADDCDFRTPQARKIAAHGDQRRRRGGGPQKRRIIRLVNADKTRAQPLRRVELAFGLLARRDADGPARLAARDQGRQSRERRSRAPMAANQNLKCSGSDIFAAQEPQPIETLTVVEVGERFGGKRAVLHQIFPIRDSVPAASREILARCLTHKRIAMSPNMNAASLRPMINRTIGVAALAASAAAEEGRVRKATASQTMPKASPVCQAAARRQPRKVATPLPPLNFSQAGNKWPRKAPSAAASMGDPGAKWATSETATIPFKRSRRRVNAAKSLRP